jgi:DNA adenine methylase
MTTHKKKPCTLDNNSNQIIFGQRIMPGLSLPTDINPFQHPTIVRGSSAVLDKTCYTPDNKSLKNSATVSSMPAAKEINIQDHLEQKHYTGQKTASGIIEFLLNATPKANVYVEFFCGSAVFSNKISELSPNSEQLLCDKNNEVRQFIAPILSYNFQNCCYSQLDLSKLLDGTKKIFIYADPPYLFSSRRSGRKYYKFEMSDDDHMHFLSYVQSLSAFGIQIMISHPKCSLYDKILKGWHTKEIKCSSRRGTYFECIYTNYDPSQIDLLTYDFLGDGFVDRQRINRSISNILRKIENLPLQHRTKLLADIKKQFLL